ncbi:MAG: hypothetical protein V1822_04580 [Candidatus Micrarchaeota archaeon]
MEGLSYAFDFSPTSPAYSLATDLIIISLILCAIALGLARAIGSKKLWSWGVEELAQAIINAALLGSIMGLGTIAGAFTGVMQIAPIAGCSYLDSAANSPIAYSLCSIEASQNKTWQIIDGANSQSFYLGALSSMQLSFEVVSASPFSSLSYAAKNYSDWSAQLSSLLSLLELNRQFLLFISQAAFALFLPVGLLLRMFFATRKLGGAMMAGSISFFIVYPLLYAAFLSGPLLGETPIFETAYTQAYSDLNELSATLNFMPTIDWGKEPDMVQLLASLEGKNLLEQASLPYKSVSAFEGAVSMQAILYPLICLALTLICAKELSGLLGSQFRLDLFDKI